MEPPGRGLHADVDGGYQMIQGLSEPPLKVAVPDFRHRWRTLCLSAICGVVAVNGPR
ncbi:hypothetical protein AB0M44_04445 [Streptosporangium subroseum]|uniref:hypothetical protein n=1 Tax=Streptosporangium subroseum TaxID=106412 RepID=UPI003429A44C